MWQVILIIYSQLTHTVETTYVNKVVKLTAPALQPQPIMQNTCIQKINNVYSSTNLEGLAMKCLCENSIPDGMVVSPKYVKDIWLFSEFENEDLAALTSVGKRKVFQRGEAVFHQ